jgi:murein DD-endopeptidase MepM/ murein hydrolase activator NlpD
MKKRTILVVPPRGIPVKMIRIRLSVVITFLTLMSLGFLGYFIPFNNFTLNVVEANQKNNLTEQNNALLRKIISTLRLLNNLKDQVVRLEAKQKVAAQFSGTGEESAELKPGIDFQKLNTDELLQFVENREKLYESFYDNVNSTYLLENIPVIYPLEDSFVISRGYGSSIDPFTTRIKQHVGIDLVAQEGTPIIAVASGVVSRLENHPIWGVRITLEHKSGFETVYAHVGQALVNKGKKVKKGQVIGKMGLSGLSTGIHLHYEVIHKGVHINPNSILFPSLLK